MFRILHIHASPRTDSYSMQLAEAFIERYQRRHAGVGVEALNVFTASLPDFDAPAAAAKYAVMSRQTPLGHDAEAWKLVIDQINLFKSADMYVFSSPMWNFSIPYRLKQYIDILVQPGLTFTYRPSDGYKGLITGRPAVLLLARGGNYPDIASQKLDFQKTYMEMILGFIGFTDIRSVIVDGTLADTATAQLAAQNAVLEAQDLADKM